MTIRIPLRTVLVALVFVAIGAGTAVGVMLWEPWGGGDGEEQLALEQYFQQLEAVKKGAEDGHRSSAAESLEAMEAAETQDETAAAFRNLVAGIGERLRKYVTDLERIEPPSAVADTHREFVAAIVEFEGGYAAFQERSERAYTLDDVVEHSQEFEDLDFGDSGYAEEEACLALEAIANERDIDADLRCEGLAFP